MQQYYKLVGTQNVFIYTITQLYFVVCAQNVYKIMILYFVLYNSECLYCYK